LARAKYWLQQIWGLPLPASVTGYQQQDQQMFNVNTGDTLIRTRVDISIYTYITELTGVTPTYDPGLFLEVEMRFGISWVDGGSGAVPPALNDSGPIGIDWAIWDTMTPHIEVPSGSTSDGSMGVNWKCNGGVTLDSAGRRGPAAGAFPRVWASLGYNDPGEFLSKLTGTYDAATFLTIGVKCLFEAAPM
jgi:hypothetical protein